jgi:Flp pilus assembly pilin Flp
MKNVAIFRTSCLNLRLRRKALVVRMPAVLLRLRSDRRAVTALEYGIVAAFLCVGLVAVFAGFGSTVSSLFTRVETGI